MNTKHRLFPALLLGLLLCVCLASSAFADGNGVDSANLTEGVALGNAAVFYDEGDFLNALEAASGGAIQADTLYYYAPGDFQLPGSLTVPEHLSIVFRTSRLVIPNGVTLTIKGKVTTPMLDIRRGGSLVVDGGQVNVLGNSKGDFVIGGSLSAGNLGVFEAGSKQWTDNWTDEEKSRIDLNGGSLNLHFEAVKNGDAESMLAQAGGIQAENVHPYVEVRYPLVLSSDLDTPAGVFVRSYDRVTVPAGMTLTVEGQFWVMRDCVLDVFGTLENNSIVDFEQRDGDDPHLIIEDGAAYYGWGMLGFMDRSDPNSYVSGLNLDAFAMFEDQTLVYFFWIQIDLILPSDLTTIGAEAFTGDTFQGIFIPPSVVSIDDSAFANMGALWIYGHGGTEAETFANAHQDQGITFVNLR